MIANIQILRPVAVIMVVFHHGVSATWQNGTPALSLERLQAIGQSGVDLFFVISGFVMVVSTHNMTKSARVPDRSRPPHRADLLDPNPDHGGSCGAIGRASAVLKPETIPTPGGFAMSHHDVVGLRTKDA